MTASTGLSVVVGNRTALEAGVAAAVRALDAGLDPVVDEVIWVDQAGLHPRFSRVSMKTVSVPPGSGRGTANEVGLAAAQRPLVAFIDSTAVIAPSWRDAACAALEAGAGVVGGPIAPGRPRSGLGWAGFLTFYGYGAVAPFLSPSGDVHGINVAYRRELLPSCADRVLKTEVNLGLRAHGVRPSLVDDMRVTVIREFGWVDLTVVRFRSGALYATVRSTGWPATRRGVAAVACFALPLLSGVRLWARVRADRELHRRLLATSPAVAVSLVAWSAGEAAGYLRRNGRDAGVW